MKENNEAIATMDRKVAALCEDISNANDELDDLEDEGDDDDDAPAEAPPRQVRRRPARLSMHWSADISFCYG